MWFFCARAFSRLQKGFFRLAFPLSCKLPRSASCSYFIVVVRLIGNSRKLHKQKKMIRISREKCCKNYLNSSQIKHKTSLWDWKIIEAFLRIFFAFEFSAIFYGELKALWRRNWICYSNTKTTILWRRDWKWMNERKNDDKLLEKALVCWKIARFFRFKIIEKIEVLFDFYLNKSSSSCLKLALNTLERF